MRLDERLNDASGVHFTASHLIDKVISPFQTIEVFATCELGKLMRIDGCNMVSERDEFFYHENLVHPLACAHAAPKNVLIVGGGDGGSAEEILKHSLVEKIVLAELDEAVVEIAKAHFQSVNRGAFDSPRLQLQIGDGYEYLRATQERFDLVFLDLTDPGGASEPLYSDAFYASCKNVLAEGGAIGLHLGSPFSHAARVRETIDKLRGVFRFVTPWFVHIPMYGATWGFASASDDLQPRTVSAGEIDTRLAARGVGERQFYNGEMHHAMMALPEYVRRHIG
jgi:spermidine synthase